MENYIPVLSQHFRIIAPDNRGRGKTENPLGKLSYKLLAEDIVELCNNLTIEKPILCGWSDGGQTALEIAVRFPHFARAIIAGGVISEVNDHYTKGLKALGIMGPGIVDFSTFQSKIPKIEFRLKSLHTASEDTEYWKILITQLSHLWSDPTEYLGEEIKTIQIPTSIVIGEQDIFIPVEMIKNMFCTIPNVEYCILPNTGHSINSLNTAKLFSSKILDFAKRVMRSNH